MTATIPSNIFPILFNAFFMMFSQKKQPDKCARLLSYSILILYFQSSGVILAGSPENASKYYARGHTLVPPSYSKFSGPKLSGKSSPRVYSR